MAVRARDLPWALPAINRRYLVGGLLAALAAVLVLILTRPAATYPVLVAEGDLPAGSPLSTLDVGVRYVHDTDGLVEGSTLGELEDWVLRVGLAAGEPLVASVLMPPAMMSAPDVMAIALDRGHAVLGALHAGDLVDIYVTSGRSPSDEPQTRVIARDVYVVSASSEDDPINRDTVELLLAVDDDLAMQLTAAARAGALDLVRVAP